MKVTINSTSNAYGHYPSLCQIRSGRERREFAKRNSGKYDTTVAIYNTGRRLVMCPEDMPANSYYDPVPWKWIRFQDFSDDQGYLVVSGKKFAEVFRDQVLFQDFGHSSSGLATIKIGSVGAGCVIHRTFFIPPKFIQYICVHLGHVKDSLLVYSPLPYQTFVNCPVVDRMSNQYLVAAK